MYFWETKFIADIIVGYLQLKLVCDESEMSPHALKIYARTEPLRGRFSPADWILPTDIF